ncbi:MAG: YjbH domain-containing protein [Paracoccaceae bacterium]
MTTKLNACGLGLLTFCLSMGSLPAGAQSPRLSYSSYGTPGLIDMPTARSLPDAELATTLFHFADNSRATIAFQIAPRLTASFRYSALDGLGGARDILFDRSFDLHYRLVDEARLRPAVAVGLRDFIGTGVYSSEYLVATKTLSPRLSVTAGLGWGRLGTSGGFSNPLGGLSDRLKTRPTSTSTQLGGQVESTQWFRGDAAFFGGLAWQATDQLQLKLEYSSDAYVQEEAGGLIDRNAQWNVGLDYRNKRGTSFQAFYLYGGTVGASVTFANNAKTAAAPSGTHPAPFPVRARAPGADRDLGWVNNAQTRQSTDDLLQSAMANEGLEVEAVDLQATRVQIHIRNTRYSFVAEAIGRTARVLSQVLPNSVETFVIVPTELGVPISAVTLQRRDIEAFEHLPDGSEQILARAQITEAPKVTPGSVNEDLYPRFLWALGPYFRVSLFDPDEPFRTDYGLQLNAEYNVAPGLFLSGSLRQRLGGNIGDDVRASDSVLPRVRSESGLFAQEGTTALETLTLAYYFRPGRNLYGRVTAGYLEPQFAGISTELLWKRVDSRFALGGELNYAVQRDFDQGFGLQNYDVVNGHVSAYWELGNGFHSQLDVGRYLAGDLGTTITVDREFRNGWRVGAYATLTDVSFSDFGEGSFDKGLRFVIPLEPILGQPTRRKFATVLQPLSRDGGAKLQVNGRLYESVRSFHGSGLESSWGRFWR